MHVLHRRKLGLGFSIFIGGGRWARGRRKAAGGKGIGYRVVRRGWVVGPWYGTAAGDKKRRG